MDAYIMKVTMLLLKNTDPILKNCYRYMIIGQRQRKIKIWITLIFDYNNFIYDKSTSY